MALDNQLDLGLDYYQSYDTASFPELISMEYLGTPVFPAPCHATVFVFANRTDVTKPFEYYHYVGTEAGWMYLDYKTWSNGDTVEVYHNGIRIATTLDPQYVKRGFLYFYYDPKESSCFDIMVRLACDNQYQGDPLSVYYSLYCPSMKGSREYRHDCFDYPIYSAGHPCTEDNFSLGKTDDDRLILIQVDSGQFPTKFELFSEDDRLLDTTDAVGKATLEFFKDKDDRTLDNICVRATSAIGCNWNYLVHCPIKIPDIEVLEYDVPYNCEAALDYDDSGFEWIRVFQSNLGTKNALLEWGYGYEYAVVVRTDTGELTTGVYPMIEPDVTAIGWHKIALTPTTSVSFWRTRGDLTGAGIAATGGTILAVFTRAIIIGTPDNNTNSWERVSIGSNPAKVVIEDGYEYYAIQSSLPVMSVYDFTQLKHWSTDYGAPTYMVGAQDFVPFGIWGSNDGININRRDSTTVLAIYEFEVKVEGEYGVWVWGNDDPMIGIYEGPYKGNTAFNYKSGAWEGYTNILYYYVTEDDHYDRYKRILKPGKYTVRAACRNDNGGNAYVGVFITLNGHYEPHKSRQYEGVIASHFILPTADFGYEVDALMSKSFGTADIVKDNLLQAVYNRNPPYPTLIKLYRRPLYKARDADDLAGWRVDRAGPDSMKEPLLWTLDRDYFVYHRNVDQVYIQDVINYRLEALSGARFLIPEHVNDMEPKTWTALKGFIYGPNKSQVCLKSDTDSILSETRSISNIGVLAKGISTVLSRKAVLRLKVSDIPIFSTWDFEKLQSWTMSSDNNTAYNTTTCRLFKLTPEFSGYRKYGLWLSLDGVRPLDSAARNSYTTTWKFQGEAGAFIADFGGDDDVRITIHELDAQGNLGAQIFKHSHSDKSREFSSAINLKAIQYQVMVYCQNDNGKNNSWSRNPGWSRLVIHK